MSLLLLVPGVNLVVLYVAAHAARRPLGFVCIAPVVAAATFGEALGGTLTLTIGNDATVAEHLEQMGARHQPCTVSECVVDEANRIVTTPAYMLAQRITEVYEGVRRLVEAVLRLY